MNHFVFLNFYFGAKNARHGNSLLVRRVSQGRIIMCHFEQNMLFLVKLNTEYPSQLLVEAKVTCSLFLFLLAAKKKAVIVSFR